MVRVCDFSSSVLIALCVAPRRPSPCCQLATWVKAVTLWPTATEGIDMLLMSGSCIVVSLGCVYTQPSSRLYSLCR
jgi:hypothetical protein